MKRLILLSIMLLASACPIERWFPGRVADGVARLSVANTGLFLMARYQQEKQDASIPDNCRLFLINQRDGTEIIGIPHHLGSVLHRYHNCTIDFGDRFELKNEQQEVIGHLSGKLQFSGERRVNGYLTGNSTLPIIPQGNTPIEFQFKQILFDYFQGKLNSTGKKLQITKGEMSIKVGIHLASSEQGLCNKLVHNLTIQHLKYQNHTMARLNGIFGDFDVDINGAIFDAQQGIHDNDENMLDGHLTVWNHLVRLPSDNRGLDPNYTPQQLPDYNCPIDEFLALNSARLLMLNIGVLAMQVSSDKNCGLSSIWYLDKESETENSRSIENCQITTPSCYLFDTDCLDTKTYLEGNVTTTFHARMIGQSSHLFGFSGKPIPTDPQNALLTFHHVQFDNYAASLQYKHEQQPFVKLVLKNGTLSGGVEPIQAARGNTPDIFDIPTPNAFIYDVKVKDIDASLEVNLAELPHLEGIMRIDTKEDSIMKLPIHIDRSNLSAQHGYFRGTQNQLEGNITLNGKQFHFREGTPLDPQFDQTIFDASYSCKL